MVLHWLRALLPLGVCYVLFCSLAYRRGAGIRASVLIGGIAWGVLLVAIVEVLSLFHALTLWRVFSAWGAAAVVLVFALEMWGMFYGHGLAKHEIN